MHLLSHKIRCAVRYIEDHLFDETLTAGTVEQYVANGCAQLRTQFKRETGYTVGRWIEGARLRRASDLLAESQWTVAEISFEVGYASHEVFCRAFRRVMGMSPTQYRRKHQAKSSSEMIKTRVAEPAILYSVRTLHPSAPAQMQCSRRRLQSNPRFSHHPHETNSAALPACAVCGSTDRL